MQRKLLSVILLCLVLSSAGALADGDTYVGGPWGTRITSLPCTISAPGAYYLGGNLSYAGGTGITITAADHVTLDLMGFTLNASNGTGIYINGRKNVEIRNGTVLSGSDGITTSAAGNANLRILNVRVTAGGNGIRLAGPGHLIKGCEVAATGAGDAISVPFDPATVSGCTLWFATGNGLSGYAGLISGNVVIGALSVGVGVSAEGQGSVIIGNEVSGCHTGIYCGSGASIIGNTVNTGFGHFGIALIDAKTNMLDQNTVCGTGTHYNPSTLNLVAKRNNY